jgi:hypothetical protein
MSYPCDVYLQDDIVIEGVAPAALERALAGRRFIRMSRKGKYM